MPHDDLPTQVRKRDGRLVPFETDKISQALFAATEDVGRPDAFLARELADGVLHFLIQESAGAIPTTDQIADLALKVTRELGHPALASAFLRRRAAALPKTQRAFSVTFQTDDSPARAAARARRAFQRHAVYTRDLLSAMDEGLLRRCLDGPLGAIAALALEPARHDIPMGDAMLVSLLQHHKQARIVAIDGPDHWLAVDDAATWYARLDFALRAMHRRAVLNLHCATPPAWAREERIGPLFGAPAAPDRSATRATALALLACPSSPRIACNVHVNAEDVGDPAHLALLQPAIAKGLTCTLDRGDPSLGLSAVLRRSHPACLMNVGLDLARLLRLPAVDGNLDRFLEKLPSLAGMAISVAAQRRAFLVRWLPRDSFLLHGFLLHRARLQLAPRGLSCVVQELVGRSPLDADVARDLARLIIRTIAQAAASHGQKRNVETVVTLAWPERHVPFGDLAADTILESAQALAKAGADVCVRLAPTTPDACLQVMASALKRAPIDRLRWA